MLVYSCDILELFKKKGITTYALIHDLGLSSQTVQQIRSGKVIGIKTLSNLCDILECQPNEILTWVKTD